jgi:redox-sensitive bicupin YhaK (pirin superfamily)
MQAFSDIALDTDLTLIGSGHFFRVGEAQFGVRGLIAIESVGPWSSVQHMGPMLMIHDAFFEPGFGIGHHPHRTNERLFYILNGRVEHDDSLNHIRGTMNEGDLGRLTEGVRGMLHQEWNGAEGQVTRAFILVYHPDTDPPIPVAEFAVLRAEDRVPIADGSGVETLELIGPMSPFRVNHSGLHRYADTTLSAGASLELRLAPNSGLLLYPAEGSVSVARASGEPAILASDGSFHPEGPAAMAIAWSTDAERKLAVTAGDVGARILQVEFGRGAQDLVIGSGYLG